MTKLRFWAVALLLLSGCSSTVVPTQCQLTSQERGNMLPPHGPLNAVVDQMALELLRSRAIPLDNRVMAVATPVAVTDYQYSGDLEKQVEQGLISALQQRCVPIVEINTPQMIRVGPTGNQMLSRNAELLARQAKANDVLLTTVSQTPQGLQLYARVVSLENHYLVASSQTTVAWAELGLEPVTDGPLPFRLYRHADGSVHGYQEIR